MGCSEPSLELSDLGQIRVERVSNIWKTARGAFDLSHARSQFLECRAKEFHCVSVLTHVLLVQVEIRLNLKCTSG